MSIKTSLQKHLLVLEYSGSLAQSGSFSGSAYCAGAARVVGIAVSSGSGKDSASTLMIEQASSSDLDWDYSTGCALSACSGSGFSIEILGPAVKVTYRGDTTASSNEVRMYWSLRGI